MDRGELGRGRKGKSLAPKGALGPDTGGRSPCGATGRALPGGRTGLARAEPGALVASRAETRVRAPTALRW